MSEALRALVAEAARVVPGLEGHVVTTGTAAPWHAGTGLAAVQRFWVSRHPEAGPHYAALRGWGLLVWQPIYVAVIAAHVGNTQPDLDCLSLVVDEGDVCGYRFGAHALRRSEEAGRMHFGAAQIAAGIERLLPAWQVHAPLHAKAARRTCADCALAALLAVRRQRQWSSAHTRELGAQWLDALGLPGESGFLAYPAASGTEAMALEHKVCCLHFRRRDGERCNACPKRPLAERIERLKDAVRDEVKSEG